ncbi:Unknown protein [Striga hermonthica]|uniref:Late embryogenesis abundant protein LEA-2 subgroup domain-containing protein n=1 Tax=Striga hermonthica TaxID=68872 RepID=A0A9N7NQS8_STRHE|nr:Unknown protein [Striga hermonthica]
MAENGSPRRIRWPADDYNRLTTLEVDHERPRTPDSVPEFRQLYNQIHSACHLIDIDWDRICVLGLATISVMLIVLTFFPFLQTQLVLDQNLHHQFSLKSLTISEFQAESDRLTGKCNVSFNISNPTQKSVYHEHSVLSIFLDHELLWVTRTLDFFIDIGDSIAFNVSINRTTVAVPDSFVPTAFLESRALNKSLHFKLKYDGMMREGMAAWEEERAHLYVICGWIQVAFVDNTTLKGGPANCSIEN